MKRISESWAVVLAGLMAVGPVTVQATALVQPNRLSGKYEIRVTASYEDQSASAVIRVKKCRSHAKTPRTQRRAQWLSLRSLRLGVKCPCGLCGPGGSRNSVLGWWC